MGSDWTELFGDPLLAVDHAATGVTVYASGLASGRSEVVGSTDGGPWVEVDTGLTGTVQSSPSTAGRRPT